MASVTLGNLVTRARRHADQVGSPFKTDDDLKRQMLTVVARLRQKLHTGGQEYERITKERDTVAGQAIYDMPSDFNRLMLLLANRGQQPPTSPVLELPLDGWSSGLSDATGWVQCFPFELAEMHQLLNRNDGSADTIRYRMRGELSGGEAAAFKRQIELRPTPRSVFTLRIEYLPITSVNTDSATLVEGIDGFDEIVALEGGIYLLEAEESDASHLWRRLQRLEKDLDEIAPGQDMNKPERVVDIYAQQHATTIDGLPYGQRSGRGWWP